MDCILDGMNVRFRLVNTTNALLGQSEPQPHLAYTIRHPNAEEHLPPHICQIPVLHIRTVALVGDRTLILKLANGSKRTITIAYIRPDEIAEARDWFVKHLISCRTHERIDWTAQKSAFTICCWKWNLFPEGWFTRKYRCGDYLPNRCPARRLPSDQQQAQMQQNGEDESRRP